MRPLRPAYTMDMSQVSNSNLDALAGKVDLSVNPHIDVVLDTVRTLSEAKDPQDVLLTFAKGIREFGKVQTYMSISTRGLKPGEFRITRWLAADTDLATANDPWKQGDAIPVNRGGLITRIVSQDAPVLINDLQVDDDPVLGDRLKPFRSLMAIPLFDDGQALNWAISLFEEPDAMTVEELQEYVLRSNLVGGTVRHVLTAKKLREANNEIAAEVDRIASIQRALLPRHLPKIPGLSIGASYETYDQAGGDMYDFLPLADVVDGDAAKDDPRWAILIGDASGHGPGAAVVMAMVHAIMHAYPRRPEGPGEMLAYLNRHLSGKQIESSFVTAFLAFYCPKSHTITYARAGHNPPILRPRNGANVPMRDLGDVGGLPLGILPDETYEESAFVLEPNYTLVLYTDGITEAMNDSSDEFGIGGIEQSLVDCSGEPQCAIGHITQSLRQHESGMRPKDDQTILAIQRVE